MEVNEIDLISTRMRFSTSVLLLLFIFLRIENASSQGKINVPSYECLGNLTNFTYTPPSGLTLSSISWDFGDGVFSSNTSPSHTYTTTGIYFVKVQATFTNSSTAKDTQKIEVVGLPKPGYFYIPSSDSCYLGNSVCYRDTSSPAATGQTIVSRMMVWGDGSFTIKTNPTKGDSICHQYPVADKYTIKMELTDKYGCKASLNKELTIAENIKPNFSITYDFFDCQTGRVCLKNLSTVGAKPANSHYRWYVDTFSVDTGSYFVGSKCYHFKNSKLITIKLITDGGNLCVDTMTQQFNVVVDPLPTKIDLLDTLRCFSDGSLNEATIPNVKRDDIKWYFDGVYNPKAKANTFYFFTRVGLGYREVKVEIIRGGCTYTLRNYVHVIGPMGRMKIIDGRQCFSNREVFLYDTSSGVPRERMSYKWIIPDPNGENCVNYRTKDINKNRNCNESRDWWTRHQFAINSEPMFVMCVMTDTVTGCFDTSRAEISMKDCSPILLPDTFDVCQDDIFKDKVLPPYPEKFSIDTGKNWILFPNVLAAPLKGTFDVGFTFKTTLYEWAEKFGDDSILIHRDTIDFYDTVFRKQKIIVHEPRQDSLIFDAYNDCRPFALSVKFKTPDFYKGDRIEIYWGDSGNIDTTYRAYEKVDSIMHIYNRSGFNSSILIVTTNKWGCIFRKRYDIAKGLAMSMSTPKFINCKYDSVCFYPGVYSFRSNQFWTSNTPNNKVSWNFPDAGGKTLKFNPCVNFNKGGFLPYEMMISDSFGCKDTLRDSIFIQDVRANYKRSGNVVYCSELKQFFDSSSFFKNPEYRDFYPTKYIDSIKIFSWQFGNGTFSSLQRNPLQTLNTSLDKIPAAHAVETYSGCKDTIFFEINVIGPKPYFTIKDTIGCNSLDAVFVNNSRFSKQYIWAFGDSANTTFQTPSKADQNFKYTKPGRYYISLTGIDTVYNPFTKKYEACVVTFPDKLFQKDTHRTVLVLPLIKTGISSIDTICTGSQILFTSLSDSGYIGEFWDFGDTTFKDTGVSPSKVAHAFQKTGSYTVQLKPYYKDIVKDQCRDSSSKTIVVMGVTADFELGPNSKAPIFNFNNKSVPGSASYNWDFGQDGSLNSTETNPSYNYGNDTGQYNVCLIATIPYGCADTVCKQIFNDYLSAFQIGNVFTPGALDGKNDQFDIIIEGESSYHLQIYNRWGVLVYESFEDAEDSDNKNWNGKLFNTGEECPSGTYYYIFDFGLKKDDGKSQVIQGVITLIR